jgi:hypothetical protein
MMPLKWFSFLSIGVLTLSGCSSSATQGQVTPQMQEARRKSDEWTASLTDAEKRVEGSVVKLVRLAEAADTSADKAAELHEIISRRRYDLQPDSLDRVRLIFELTSTAYSQAIARKIESAGGIVLWIGTSPWVECRIHPRALRPIMGEEGIFRIRVPSSGGTDG